MTTSKAPKNWSSLLNELTAGVSSIGDLYIKHPTIKDIARQEELRTYYIEQAVEKGFRTLNSALEEAHQSGFWTANDEKSWHGQLSYIKKLQSNYKTIAESQKEDFLETISDELKKYTLQSNKRSKYLAKTAEDWSDKLTFENYAPSLFFKDLACSSPAYDEDEIQYWGDSEFDIIYQNFLEFKDKFPEETLKELACSPLCQNLFFIADSPSEFYGKSALKLTILQQNLFIFTKNYNNIIVNLSGKVQPSILTDYEALDDWSSGTEKDKERLEGQWSGNDNGGITYEDIKKNARQKHATREDKIKSMQNLMK